MFSFMVAGMIDVGKKITSKEGTRHKFNVEKTK